MRRLPVVVDPDGTVHDPECALCSAACCRTFHDIPLTEEEHRSGKYESAEIRPNVFSIRLNQHRVCPHLSSEQRCGVYHDRPLTCRVYSCRNDTRISQADKFRPL